MILIECFASVDGNSQFDIHMPHIHGIYGFMESWIQIYSQFIPILLTPHAILCLSLVYPYIHIGAQKQLWNDSEIFASEWVYKCKCVCECVCGLRTIMNYEHECGRGALYSVYVLICQINTFIVSATNGYNVNFSTLYPLWRIIIFGSCAIFHVFFFFFFVYVFFVHIFSLGCCWCRGRTS